MPDHAAFLEEILANPEEDLPRLVYADWLDEQGDPRGEFIRVQCLLAKLPLDDDRRWPLKTREELLLRSYGKQWARPVSTLWAGDWEFRRGFVEKIKIRAATFLEHAKEFFAAAPIRGVKLLSPENQLSAFANSPWLERINSLDFSDSNLTWFEFEDLAYSPDLVHLKELNLRSTPLCSDQGFQLLSKCEFLRNLTTLDLSNYSSASIGLFGLDALSRFSTFEKLSSLDLSGYGRSGRDIILAIVDSPVLDQIETLNLSGDGSLLVERRYAMTYGNPLGRFFSSQRLGNLRRLRLVRSFKADSITDFADAKSLKNLESFEAGGTNIPSTAQAGNLLGDFATSPNVSHLSRLRFMGCSWPDAATDRLCQSKQLSCLKELDLEMTELGEVGLKILARSALLNQLQSLNLSKAKRGIGDPLVDDDGLKILAERESKLQVLDLSHQPITDITPLADSAMAGPLCDLRLARTKLDASAVARLCDAGAFPNLELVDLSGVNLNDEAKAKLEKRFGAGVTIGRSKPRD